MRKIAKRPAQALLALVQVDWQPLQINAAPPPNCLCLTSFDGLTLTDVTVGMLG